MFSSVRVPRDHRDEPLRVLPRVMDLVVTQIVDGTKGVHALMPKAIFKK
jgi:acetamidase/formamidase